MSQPTSQDHQSPPSALPQPAPATQQNGSAPPSPSMSQAQQQNGQRQAVSYPEPTSYPSPSLSSAQYSYPAPSNQQVNEPYRASPTGSNGAMPLPSMRSLDPLTQQPPPHMTSPLPPAMGQPPYYQGQGQPLAHQYPNVAADPTGAMRYAIPAPDNRAMSGGRHKKEIKRRTKTGCLTCRKRRIKCDEQHPVCRNCQKSKRECLGYDPIFKQTPGPAAIQPAPSASPVSTTPTPVNAYPASTPMIQSSYPPQPGMGYDAPLGSVTSPSAAPQVYDYTSAIDPALESAAPPPAPVNANLFQPPQPSKPIRMERVRTTMEELLDLSGPIPPALPSSANSAQSPESLDEVKHYYHSMYAPGFENFLESKWFGIKGVGRLMSDSKVLEQFLGLLETCAHSRDQSDPKILQFTASVEARLVWSLACMVRSATSSTNGVDGEIEGETRAEPKVEGEAVLPAADDATETTHRLAVFEHLLCGQVLPSNPLVKPTDNIDPMRLREFQFWYNLGEFVRINEDEPNAPVEMEEVLSVLRTLLDGRENRDVLYSIAVVRALGPRVTEYSDTDPMPLHLDEHDPRSKLVVARRFIEDEGNGGGTTNVIRRFCNLAAQAWAAASVAAAVKDSVEALPPPVSESPASEHVGVPALAAISAVTSETSTPAVESQ